MADHNKYHNGHIPSNGYYSGLNSSLESDGMNAKDDALDLKQLFYTVWNRKWFIISTVLLVGFLAALIAFFSTPIYQSNGSMIIEDSKGAGGLGGGEGIGQLLSSTYGIGVGSTFANELQVLRSRNLSNAVADTLIEDPIMLNGHQFPVLFRSYPDDSTITSQDTVASRLRKKFTFSEVDRDADVVKITYESPSPYETAKIVNLTMQLYQDLSRGDKRSSANSAVSFLEKERYRIKNNLQDSEQRLRQFMNNSKLVQVDSQTDRLIQQMADLEARRQEARAKLVAANSGIKQYENQLEEIKPGLAEQYSEAVGAKVQRFQYQLAELELKKERMFTNYPDLRNTSNPPSELLKLNKEIKSYQQRINDFTKEVINESDQYIGFLGGNESGIASSITELNQKLIELRVQKNQFESQIEVIDAQLKKHEHFFNSLPDNIIDLAQLKRDVKINEELFVAVSKQYAETALWEQTQFGLGRIVDRGYIPKEPVAPNKPLYILVGFILGGILSVGYILVKDAFNTTIDGVEKMKKRNETLLSVIPTMDGYVKEHHDGESEAMVQGKNISTGLITILDTISPISESFRRLENNLIYSNPDAKMNSIMVTSSAKGEGKTTTISNLGVVLSEAGYKTIIVDTDFRRPNLDNMFDVNKSPGIMEVLFDGISIEEAVKETIVPGLYVLSIGRRPPNASAITQSKAFLSLLKSLENDFDFVLIDTPPFGIITDASSMMRQTDGVVVVAKFRKTNEVQLNETLEQLHHINASILGTVLTAFDHTESSDYYMSSNYYKEVYQDYNAYQKDS